MVRDFSQGKTRASRKVARCFWSMFLFTGLPFNIWEFLVGEWLCYTHAGQSGRSNWIFCHLSTPFLFPTPAHPSSSTFSNSLLNNGNLDRNGVWISVFHLHRFLRFSSPFSAYFKLRLRRYIKHSTQHLTIFPNTKKFMKNTPLPVAFSTLFSAFGNALTYGLSWGPFVFDTRLRDLSQLKQWSVACFIDNLLRWLTIVLIIQWHIYILLYKKIRSFDSLYLPEDL